MTALENLWYGNLRPVEEFLANNKEYKGLLRLVSKNREKLENSLSSKQAKLFQEYYTATNEMNDISETAAFQYGFNIATKLLIDNTEY